MSEAEPIEVLLVAVPESAGSSLYGLLDVLSAAGSIWDTLVREGPGKALFRVRIVSRDTSPFSCGNGIPVQPHCSFAEAPTEALVIVPELWLGPDESIHGRYPELVAWLQQVYRAGGSLYSACSGALLLAETGLLDGCPATSHWAYQDQFRTAYPKVRFDAAPSLLVADPQQRIVTAGGTSSWHDLALHIIARHAGIGEALRIAKVYLLKWHDEGQLPYAQLVRAAPHADAVVRRSQEFLKQHYREPDVLSQLLQQIPVPERTLKRRFKRATGMALLEYAQSLRIEAAKQELEQGSLSIEEIGSAVGYADFSFFRRLFKRMTGLKPAEYRRMFKLPASPA
jgi:transcriptional regulator GlxA family with amidase domain